MHNDLGIVLDRNTSEPIGIYDHLLESAVLASGLRTVLEIYSEGMSVWWCATRHTECT